VKILTVAAEKGGQLIDETSAGIFFPRNEDELNNGELTVITLK
jgi:hypothetical protein